MGISRDSRHKRRLTGGRRSIHQKKRAFEKGRPFANTRIGEQKVRKLRVRGGNTKYRALRLNKGNFVWQSEKATFVTKIINVVYNASNNEYIRTNTLTKNTIVRVDATAFKKFLAKRYFGEEDPNFELNFDWETEEQYKAKKAENKASRRELKYLQRRAQTKIEPKLQEQILKGQIYACLTSRPGQSGRADGYLLEGRELDFYAKKIEKK
jgi:small subunit ribosomal protein S8e